MPQVEDDPIMPTGYRNRDVGNLNNFPSINGSNLGLVGNSIITGANYTPVQKYTKAPQMAYGSGAKYNYPSGNSIEAINQAYMQRSRSKDAVTLASQLKSNRYGGGAASVIAEGRLE